MSAYFIFDLLITFKAYRPRLLFSSARYTFPKRPLPNLLPSLKLFRLSCGFAWLRFFTPIFYRSFSLLSSIFLLMVVWLADLATICGNSAEESIFKFLELGSFFKVFECSL